MEEPLLRAEVYAESETARLGMWFFPQQQQPEVTSGFTNIYIYVENW